MVVIFLVCDEILKCVTTYSTYRVCGGKFVNLSIYKTLTDDYWYILRKEKPTLQILVIKLLSYRIVLFD